MATKKPTKKPGKQASNPALKYAGMAMQMAVTIGLGIFIGQKLDAYLETSKPYFTILFAVVFLSAIMYSICLLYTSPSPRDS